MNDALAILRAKLCNCASVILIERGYTGGDYDLMPILLNPITEAERQFRTLCHEYASKFDPYLPDEVVLPDLSSDRVH